MQDVKLEKILGPSRDGQWLDDEESTALRGEGEEEEEENDSGSDGQSRFYSVVIT